ncbi:hypothetical protein EDB86DRAFT_338012 [Lactarius hatsudake]|nr:hypothetical protein EDB86DRAFT_338012 [Lactarius hatsudake]
MRRRTSRLARCYQTCRRSACGLCRPRLLSGRRSVASCVIDTTSAGIGIKLRVVFPWGRTGNSIGGNGTGEPNSCARVSFGCFLCAHIFISSVHGRSPHSLRLDFFFFFEVRGSPDSLSLNRLTIATRYPRIIVYSSVIQLVYVTLLAPCALHTTRTVLRQLLKSLKNSPRPFRSCSV